jgi:UDP-glucose:(heptosyl)LPS alpha-1,3-glucosyltransferase
MLKDDLIREYGVDARKIRVIHHGVDLDVFHPRNRETLRERIRSMHGVSRNEFVVLFVGGDYRGKGLLTLLEAVATLPGEVKVLAVGLSPDRALMRVVSERRVGARTVFIPPTSDIVGFYAAADCFVLPTRYDTFSLVTLEAMASGLPVLVSGRAGICEILTRGVDSLILDDPTDHVTLREILSHLREDDLARTRLALEARATAERHSWDRVVVATLQVYHEVLAVSS